MAEVDKAKTEEAKKQKADDKAKKAAEKAAAAAAKVSANGVTRPKSGTKTGRIWDISDELSAAAKSPAARKDVMQKATSEGINEATAATQYGRWRKFHGLKGVTPAVPSDGSATPAAKA